MESPSASILQNSKLPNKLVWAVVAVSVIPIVLHLLGVDFGSRKIPFDTATALSATGQEVVEAMFVSLTGSFTHTILEWSAFVTAIFVVILAFVHFRIQGDITTPVVGVALFCAGSMDAFHTLAADRLIHAVADNRDLIPFTWAISRMFNALIMLAGVGIFLVKRRPVLKGDLRFVLVVSAVFGAIAYGIIQYTATRAHLPQTTFPDSIITRPYDVVPLVLFLFAGAVIYPWFYRRYPSPFSHALLISVIPEVATEMHMAFGSTALFDSHFNMAHFIKILAYLVPFAGLCLDYIRSYTALRTEISERKQAVAALADSEERHRAIFANAVDAIITIDEHGTIDSCNPATARLFGYSAADLEGKNINMLMPSPHQEQHDGYLRRYLETGESKIIGVGRELEARRKDGSTFPIDLAITVLELGDRRLFTGTVRDITERKKVDLLKNEFVSTVSHELRTPLTSIRGALGMLQGGVVGEFSPRAGKMIDIALQNSDRLVRLINDILDIEKIESGNLVMKRARIDLVTLVEAAIEANRSYAQEFRVDLQLTSHPPVASVRGDADRLTQVVTNLLSNAVKFSPGEGKVWVEIAQIGDRIRVAVSDQGPGVSQEFQSLIFQKFAQADSSDTRQKGGTGLGLNISKAIVEKHGGTIGFDTEIGKGATFFFELPAWKEERTGPARVQVRIAAERVLICENNPDFAHLLTLLIEQAGFQADVALNTQEARRRLLENRYAAITLDPFLPEDGGFALICKLRKEEGFPSIPIIVITAGANEDEIELNGLTPDIVDWIRKPVDNLRLAASIEKAVQNVAGKRKKILHVEDDSDLVYLTTELVSDFGDVVHAPSLAVAKRLLREEKFDLILLDLGMPDGNGLELLSDLHQHDSRGVPVVVFSAHEMDPADAARVNAALVKSKDTYEDLVARVRSLVAQNREN